MNKRKLEDAPIRNTKFPKNIIASELQISKTSLPSELLTKNSTAALKPFDVPAAPSKATPPAFPEVRKGAFDDALFSSFARKSAIRPFRAEMLPPMKKPSSYNDDVRVPHFVSARRAYLGAQRKGIVDDHPNAKSIKGLVVEALRAPFVLDQAIPLPESTKKALNFLRFSRPEDVAEFLKLQLYMTSSLVEAATPHEKHRGKLIPSQIRPAAEKIELPAFLSLMLQLGLGGSRWRRQFIYGFKLVGRLRQCDTFPSDPRMTKNKILPTKSFFSEAPMRFSERPQRSGTKNAELLWKEAMGQKEKGWLGPPSSWIPPAVLFQPPARAST